MFKDFTRHTIFKLLRFCAAARNVHLFRTISPAHSDVFAKGITTRTTNMFLHGFLAENRRVASALTQAALGRRWTYPTYREGLRGILAQERADDAGEQGEVRGTR